MANLFGEWRRWLLGAFGLVALANLHCAPDPVASERFRRSMEVGVDQMEGVDWWFYSQDMVKAHAMAGKASWQRSQNRLEFYDGLEVVFYDASGRKVVSRLKALGGSRDTKKAILEAKGRVVTNNLAGDTLFTEHLLMDEGSGRVYTNGPVRIRTPREELRGEGLEANRDLSQYRILKLTGSVRWGGRS